MGGYLLAEPFEVLGVSKAVKQKVVIEWLCRQLGFDWILKIWRVNVV